MLCTGCTAHRGSPGIALIFLDHGTRRGWGVSVTPWPLFTSGKDPVPIVQGARWAPAPVWTGAENLASTGIRSSDRPARSQSLYDYATRKVCSCGKIPPFETKILARIYVVLQINISKLFVVTVLFLNKVRGWGRIYIGILTPGPLDFLHCGPLRSAI